MPLTNGKTSRSLADRALPGSLAPTLAGVESVGALVTAGQVPGLLFEAWPWLSEIWDEVADDNADADCPGGRLGYLDAAWVVGQLADHFAAGDTSGFDAMFDLIERLVIEGDGYVSELGVIGYLEGMQMATVSSRGVDPEAFRPWLRPMSARYWQAICDFWERGIPIPTLHPE